MNAGSLLTKMWRVAYAFGVCMGAGLAASAFQPWGKYSAFDLFVGVALAAYCFFRFVRLQKPDGDSN